MPYYDTSCHVVAHGFKAVPANRERNSHNVESLEKSVIGCFDNGDMLFDDARNLADFESFPTAYAISILAQEEFAKAFLLYLIQCH